jgi:hypothetical protein
MNIVVMTYPQNQWVASVLKDSIARTATANAKSFGLDPSAIDRDLLAKRIYLDMLGWVVPAGNA